MATTTPNYGWDVPTSTDYVADGAVAIETLGDDIDASLFSITGGKNVGYQLIASSSFSSASDVVVSNCFSASYNSYLVELNFSTASQGQNGFQMLTTGTTADTGNVYNSAGTGYNSNGSSSVYANENVTVMRWASRGDYGGLIIAHISNPFGAFRTVLAGNNAYSRSTAPYMVVGAMAGQVNTTTSYSGFKYLALTDAGSTGGNVTGSIRVYGKAL